MDHWSKDLPNANDYAVYLDGKRESITCIEAQSSTNDTYGWVKRRWMVMAGFASYEKERKFYGKVHIVRVTE